MGEGSVAEKVKQFEELAKGEATGGGAQGASIASAVGNRAFSDMVGGGDADGAGAPIFGWLAKRLGGAKGGTTTGTGESGSGTGGSTTTGTTTTGTGGSTTTGTTTTGTGGSTTTGTATIGSGRTTGSTGGSSSGTTPPPAVAPPGPWTLAEIKAFKTDATDSLTVFKAVAARDTLRGVAMLRLVNDLGRVITGLPSPTGLGDLGRAAVQKIVLDGKLLMAEVVPLFKKRFGHDLQSTAATATTAKVDWTMDNVKVVWKQLDLLPEADVSKNTVIGVFRASAGGGGMYYGGSGNIDLGQTQDAKTMAHTVRHEVGHGVHDKLAGTVNSWLKNDMKVWYGSLDAGGVDELVGKLGGYPAKYNGADGTEHAFDDNAKSWIRHYIGGFTGSTSWSPAKASPDQVEVNAWGSAAWDAMPAAVKEMCAQSKAHWYSNYANFQTGTDGNRYFLNHWYHKWFSMSPKAKSVVDATGEDYTAMSEKEFFANTYAEFFADPKGKQDPAKWGGKLPEDVQEFMRSCVLDRTPYDEYTEKQKKKLTSK